NIDEVGGDRLGREVMRKRVFAEHVITVDPGGECAGSHSQTAIDCGALSTIGLADPEVDPLRILFDDLNGSVAAPTIDDEVLEIRVFLKEDRSDRCLEELPLV